MIKTGHVITVQSVKFKENALVWSTVATEESIYIYFTQQQTSHVYVQVFLIYLDLFIRTMTVLICQLSELGIGI